MKAYKGFDKDMKCRGFQFKEGETYEEPEAKLCERGFHACEAPLDCFNYYAPAQSEYHEVELEEVTDERENDTKRVGKKIKIGAKLSIRNLVDAQIEYVNERTIPENSNHAAGDRGAASATGDRGAASATGDWGAASATGDRGAASATGVGCIAVASGYLGRAKAAIGCAICLCERGEWNGITYPLLSVKAAIIDGITLKPDVWYILKNGEFTEVRDD